MSAEQQQQEVAPQPATQTTPQEAQQVTISEEDFIFALAALRWIAEKNLQSVERFFHYVMRYWGIRGYDVTYSAKYHSFDRGIELTLRVEIPEELVTFFAANKGLLNRLIRDKTISIRKDKIIREMRRLGRKKP